MFQIVSPELLPPCSHGPERLPLTSELSNSPALQQLR